jgi:DNA mismatch endonuclease, patch repair protein
MDNMTQSQRSAAMSRVRGKDTKPEMLVRRGLHRLGFRYVLHDRRLPGSPDLTFPSRKKAIFVHGCFWHQHEGCRFATVPSTRPEFWGPKLKANRDRDAAAVQALKREGWKVRIVWECELARPELVIARLVKFLES